MRHMEFLPSSENGPIATRAPGRGGLLEESCGVTPECMPLRMHHFGAPLPSRIFWMKVAWKAVIPAHS